MPIAVLAKGVRLKREVQVAMAWRPKLLFARIRYQSPVQTPNTPSKPSFKIHCIKPDPSSIALRKEYAPREQTGILLRLLLQVTGTEEGYHGFEQVAQLVQ